MLLARRFLPLMAASALAAAGCGSDGGERQDRPAQDRPTTAAVADGGGLARVPEIFRDLEPSVVAILVAGQRGQGEGSGVVFRPNHVITNNHVVEGGRDVRVALASGERVPAEVVGRDPRTDLAVLRVERELPPAQFADELPQVGSLAVAMGNPLGFENSVTAGIVSGLDRSIPSGGLTPALVGLIQTDAAISPGNSGGALAGEDASVIGINVAFIPPQARAVSIGFAIPAPTAVDVATELIDEGSVAHPFLGVSLRPLTPPVRERLGVQVEEGAVIAAIPEGSPAAEAGLRPGDVITGLGDDPVRRIEDVYRALRDREPGDELEVTVVRGGDERTETVELGERPTDGGRR